jgi:hypothetical protein
MTKDDYLKQLKWLRLLVDIGCLKWLRWLKLWVDMFVLNQFKTCVNIFKNNDNIIYIEIQLWMMSPKHNHIRLIIPILIIIIIFFGVDNSMNF